MRIVCWNTEYRKESWRYLLDKHRRDDLALLQEACTPPDDVADKLDVGPGPWKVKGAKGMRAVVGLSGKIRIERLSDDQILKRSDAAAAHPYSIAAAMVREGRRRQLLIVSVEAWEKTARRLHEMIEDVWEMIDARPPTIVAGDINAEADSGAPVFDRMESIGLPWTGPVGVTKFHRQGRQTAADADRQIDHVFATARLHKRMKVRALNTVKQWGPSDHCRIVIDL